MMEFGMKLIGKSILVSSLVLVLLMSGCDLVNKNQNDTRSKIYGQDLIINEVFTISPDKYYAYSWIEILNPTRRTIPWFDQAYPSTGSAVGEGGILIHSTNSGTAWADTSYTPSVGTIRSINYANFDTGYACGDNETIYKITTSGTVIDLSNNIQNRDQTISFNSITNQSTYLQSQDGTFDRFNRYAYVVGDKGTVYRTLNAGNSWTRVPTTRFTTKKLRSIYSKFFKLYVVGDSGGFYNSLTNGTSWNTKQYPEPFRALTFYSVFFITDSIGWVSGQNGTVLYTTNQGTSWTPETTNVSANLRGSFFGLAPDGQPAGPLFSVGSGCVVGDNGTILHTADFGQTWTHASSGTSAQLNTVYFTDSLHGFAFGNGGVALATVDGGYVWQAQKSGTTQNLLSCHFLGLRDTVSIVYYLQMYAQRNYIFYDRTTGTINQDFITHSDVGNIFFQPGPISIAPNGFAVITNDGLKFDEHTKMGPGTSTRVDFGLAFDSTGQPLKWDLLPSSQLMLIKVSGEVNGGRVLFASTQVLDCVRWGGYRPTPDPFPNNQPAPSIPEGWSLARYNNVLDVDPTKESTKQDFYLTSSPIPGWFSQLSR